MAKMIGTIFPETIIITVSILSKKSRFQVQPILQRYFHKVFAGVCGDTLPMESFLGKMVVY